jgi:competence protein ComFA
MRVRYFKNRLLGDKTLPAVSNDGCHRCLAPKERIRMEFDHEYICLDCYATSREGIMFEERPIDFHFHELAMTVRLSPMQAQGSDFFRHCLRTRQSGFLQAVCGAGKTEMLFDTLLEALNQKMKICFAIPRKPVVIEIWKRCREHFPKTIVKALYADSGDDRQAQILVSTIHQLIRYEAEFDLLILDEIDAFPYKDDPVLHRWVKKALTPEGLCFMMSATLDEATRTMIHQEHLAYHLNPARFHGHPLDIPECIQVIRLEESLRSRKLPHPIRTKLDLWENQGEQALLFVPSIALGTRLSETLTEAGKKVAFIHSQTKNNARLLADFLGRSLDFLVTTTLLERGVTFRQVNVAVFFADYPLFTKDVLVQISGRVGRHADHPTGDIVFFSTYKTRAIDESIHEILRMNQLKKQREP